MADKETAKRLKAEAKAKSKDETKNLVIWFQYVIGIIIVLGGFACGTAIGWSSPATGVLKNEYGITETEMAWVSSIFAFGAAVAQFITMFLIRYCGLKWSIIILHICVLVGWVPMFFNTFWPLLIGRFVTGMSGGFCVSCPTYLGETTHKKHRGTLGVFFQLFITGGILFAYIFGITKNMIVLNIACGSCSILGIILTVLFVPQSPYWLLKKGNTEQYDKVMVKFRGKDFDYSKETAEMKASMESTETFKDAIKESVNLKAFGVLLVLHMLQQLSGINAILYHAHEIFEASNTGISGDLSVILIGVVQVVFCLIAAAVVDRSGRILLFTVSMGVMCVCLAMVGIYFNVSKDMQKTLALIPTIGLVVYIAGFSLGTGPIPWALFGEYLPNSLKTVMSAVCAFVNWFFAFGTSWIMPVLMLHVPNQYIFYGFAILCAVGIVFILLFVVETNQKTFEQIQADIKSHKPGDLCKSKKGEA